MKLEYKLLEYHKTIQYGDAYNIQIWKAVIILPSCVSKSPPGFPDLLLTQPDL